MKIVSLQAENFKRLSAIEIIPNGNTVLITGKNGQGKSSVLDSIVMALAGGRSELSKLTTKPIREGATTATVRVETEQIIVTRTWTAKGSYIEMTNKEGMIFKSPQALLDSMIGDLCFDPLDFVKLKPKEQRDQLIDLVNLGIDLLKWQEEYDFQYEQRTTINSDVRDLKGRIETMPSVPSGTPDEEVSIAKLVEEKDVATKYLSHAQNVQQAIIDEKVKIAKMEEELSLAKGRLAQHEESLKMAGDPGEHSNLIKSLSEQIAGAEDVNRNVRTKKEYNALREKLKAWEADGESRTAKLDALQHQKDTALTMAKFPIEGLSFSFDEVLFNGIPFAQLSSALQLKVSMAIAMAKNPELRVIRITDGSLLDEDNLKTISEMADKNDYQIWIERVDSSGKVGVVIEDGHVADTPVLP